MVIQLKSLLMIAMMKLTPPMTPLNLSCIEESSDSLDPTAINNLICDNYDSGRGYLHLQYLQKYIGSIAKP